MAEMHLRLPQWIKAGLLAERREPRTPYLSRRHIRRAARNFPRIFLPDSLLVRLDPLVGRSVQVSRARQHGVVLSCSPYGGTEFRPAAQRLPAAAAEPERPPPPFSRPPPVVGWSRGADSSGSLGGHPADVQLSQVAANARSPHGGASARRGRCSGGGKRP